MIVLEKYSICRGGGGCGNMARGLLTFGPVSEPFVTRYSLAPVFGAPCRLFLPPPLLFSPPDVVQVVQVVEVVEVVEVVVGRERDRER